MKNIVYTKNVFAVTESETEITIRMSQFCCRTLLKVTVKALLLFELCSFSTFECFEVFCIFL